MILQIYSVRDSAANAFLQPFFAPGTGLALRYFQDAVNDSNHQFHKHTSDYSLWLLGSFDDSNGSVVPSEPQKIATAWEMVLKDVSPAP